MGVDNTAQVAAGGKRGADAVAGPASAAKRPKAEDREQGEPAGSAAAALTPEAATVKLEQQQREVGEKLKREQPQQQGDEGLPHEPFQDLVYEEHDELQLLELMDRSGAGPNAAITAAVLRLPICLQQQQQQQHQAVQSEQQVALRRLRRVRALSQAYQAEYWALLEELRARHNAWSEAPSASAAVAAAGPKSCKAPATAKAAAVRAPATATSAVATTTAAAATVAKGGDGASEGGEFVPLRVVFGANPLSDEQLLVPGARPPLLVPPPATATAAAVVVKVEGGSNGNATIGGAPPATVATPPVVATGQAPGSAASAPAAADQPPPQQQQQQQQGGVAPTAAPAATFQHKQELGAAMQQQAIPADGRAGLHLKLDGDGDHQLQQPAGGVSTSGPSPMDIDGLLPAAMQVLLTDAEPEPVLLRDTGLLGSGGEGREQAQEEDSALGGGVDTQLPLYEQVEQWLLAQNIPGASTGNGSVAADAATGAAAGNGGALPPPGPGATREQLLEWRRCFVSRLPAIARLEQCASALTSRRLDARVTLPAGPPPPPPPGTDPAAAAATATSVVTGMRSTIRGCLPWGVAMLVGRSKTYVVQRTAVSVGRSTRTRGAVDVDLKDEPQAHKMSRHAARISLEADGLFHLHNVGHKAIWVDDAELLPGQAGPLRHLSLLSLSGTNLLFMANLNAARRLQARMAKLAALSSG